MKKHRHRVKAKAFRAAKAVPPPPPLTPAQIAKNKTKERAVKGKARSEMVKKMAVIHGVRASAQMKMAKAGPAVAHTVGQSATPVPHTVAPATPAPLPKGIPAKLSKQYNAKKAKAFKAAQKASHDLIKAAKAHYAARTYLKKAKVTGNAKMINQAKKLVKASMKAKKAAEKETAKTKVLARKQQVTRLK